MYMRVNLPEPRDDLREVLKGTQHTAADGYCALDELVLLRHFFPCAIDQIENLHRTATEENALIGELNAPSGAVKQLYAEFLLELGNLP